MKVRPNKQLITTKDKIRIIVQQRHLAKTQQRRSGHAVQHGNHIQLQLLQLRFQAFFHHPDKEGLGVIIGAFPAIEQQAGSKQQQACYEIKSGFSQHKRCNVSTKVNTPQPVTKINSQNQPVVWALRLFLYHK